MLDSAAGITDESIVYELPPRAKKEFCSAHVAFMPPGQFSPIYTDVEIYITSSTLRYSTGIIDGKWGTLLKSHLGERHSLAWL